MVSYVDFLKTKRDVQKNRIAITPIYATRNCGKDVGYYKRCCGVMFFEHHNYFVLYDALSKVEGGENQ